MLTTEMAAYYRTQGVSLLERLRALYEHYGYYSQVTVNITMEGEQGMLAIGQIMDKLRSAPPTAIAGLPVVTYTDYQEQVRRDLVTGEQSPLPLPLPRSNVLAFVLEGNAGVIIRPSGTEPKVKAYITAVGRDAAEAAAQSETLREAAQALMQL